MRIGLYVVGDEILSGKRQDRHLANVSELLGARGLQLSWMKCIGDDLDLLTAELRSSFQSDDLVFSCGGIGATPDDMTRQAAASALDIELELHAEGLAILEARADTFDGGLTEQRKRMVEFPAGSGLIPNPVNQVPGFSMHRHYFVPGFPKMARPMIQWVLENHYPKLSNEDYREWSLTLFNVPESNVAGLMTDLQQQYSVKAFCLPHFINGGYQVELGVKGAQENVQASSELILKVMRERGYRFQENESGKNPL